MRTTHFTVLLYRMDPTSHPSFYTHSSFRQCIFNLISTLEFYNNKCSLLVSIENEKKLEVVVDLHENKFSSEEKNTHSIFSTQNMKIFTS